MTVRTVYTADAMPVCLQGDRLTFLSACEMVLDIGCQELRRYEAPDGSWDGATIPRPCRWLIGHPLSKEFRWASYWHDRLCEDSRTIEDRTLADAVLLKLLRDSGVAKWRRLAMWLAVRFYGLSVWRCRRGRFSGIR